MKLLRWEELPCYMQNESVRPYYEALKKRKLSLLLKRYFDIFVAAVLFILCIPMLIIIAILVKIDSKGNVLFLQERVTQYGRIFKIIKFRTMVSDAEKKGSQVTVQNDDRVTRIGKILRKYRLDEFPQLLNIILGDMSFVGTRPEVVKYVKRYKPEMMATLLLPAGVTSEASIEYKDEDRLLENAVDVDLVYMKKIVPGKMKYNLHSIKNFSILTDICTMFKTVITVFNGNK